jgi:hypothetical protein
MQAIGQKYGYGYNLSLLHGSIVKIVGSAKVRQET